MRLKIGFERISIKSNEDHFTAVHDKENIDSKAKKNQETHFAFQIEQWYQDWRQVLPCSYQFQNRKHGAFGSPNRVGSTRNQHDEKERNFVLYREIIRLKIRNLVEEHQEREKIEKKNNVREFPTEVQSCLQVHLCR